MLQTQTAFNPIAAINQHFNGAIDRAANPAPPVEQTTREERTVEMAEAMYAVLAKYTNPFGCTATYNSSYQEMQRIVDYIENGGDF